MLVIIYFSTYIQLSKAVTELDYTTSNSAELERFSSLLYTVFQKKHPLILLARS